MLHLVMPFQEIKSEFSQEFGGKGANLGELTKAGFNVPPGFCVRSDAYDYLIQSNDLGQQILEIVSSIDFNNFKGTDEKTALIRPLITNAKLPEDLEQEIVESYRTLRARCGKETLVAVRSSVAVKGTSISSFPGMMDTYHYLRGEEEILTHIKRCWASLWTSRAAMTRHHKKIEHKLALIAPVVQKMVHSDVAGVLFTANPITSNREEIVIEANWGLGESVVSGKSMNDFYLLDKSPLKLKNKRIAKKTVMVCFDKEKGFGRKEMAIDPSIMDTQTLFEDQIIELGRIGIKIEELFGLPQDIEWAYEKGELFILQSRNIRNLKG